MKRFLPATLAAVAAATLTMLPAAHAQQPPSRFFGALTLNGEPAPSGVALTAYINSVECGVGATRDDGLYVVDVRTGDNCGADDADVQFVVSGVAAVEIGKFQTGHFVKLDLTVAAEAQPAPPSEAPPTVAPPAEEAPAE